MKYVIFAIILDLRRKTSIHPLSQFQMNNFELIQPLLISPSWGGGRLLAKIFSEETSIDFIQLKLTLLY